VPLDPAVADMMELLETKMDKLSLDNNQKDMLREALKTETFGRVAKTVST
jgi:hypothetical protein